MGATPKLTSGASKATIALIVGFAGCAAMSMLDRNAATTATQGPMVRGCAGVWYTAAPLAGSAMGRDHRHAWRRGIAVGREVGTESWRRVRGEGGAEKGKSREHAEDH